MRDWVYGAIALLFIACCPPALAAGTGVADIVPPVPGPVFQEGGEAAGIPENPILLAHVFGKDNRVAVKTSGGDGYSAIGILSTGRLRGTAFLVGPSLILTNHHVAFGGRRTRASNQVQSVFYIGNTGRRRHAFAANAVATPVVWGDCERNRDHVDAVHDWALLQLDRTLGNIYGYLKLSPLSFEKLSMDLSHSGRWRPGEMKTAATAGFPGDRRVDRLWGDLGCHFKDAHEGPEGGWGVDCDVFYGQSGSPVFYRDGQNRIRVVALCTGMTFSKDAKVIYSKKLQEYGNGYSNLVTPVDGFHGRISRLISQDKHYNRGDGVARARAVK